MEPEGLHYPKELINQYLQAHHWLEIRSSESILLIKGSFQNATAKTIIRYTAERFYSLRKQQEV